MSEIAATTGNPARAEGHPPAPPPSGYPKHRIEGLTDGIFAVAMTLLAIELKFPENVQITTNDELGQAMLHLVPHLISWPLSFAILAIFWFAHQRAFVHLRTVDGKLVAINFLSLGFVTLLPFSTMLIGGYAPLFASHAVYAANMAILAWLSLWQIRHIASHPELTHGALTEAFIRGARFRNWSLITCAGLAVALAWIAPRFGSMAYMAMAVIAPLSRRWSRSDAPPRTS